MENFQSITIDRLTKKDQAWVVALLEEANLPTVDVNLDKQVFLKVSNKNILMAIGALETSGEYGLVRSVVVPQKLRGKGAGVSIIKALIDEAKTIELSQLFLLTETADKFFSKLGFKIAERKHVPQEISQMEEFTSICPSSAVCMTFKLK